MAADKWKLTLDPYKGFLDYAKETTALIRDDFKQLASGKPPPYLKADWDKTGKPGTPTSLEVLNMVLAYRMGALQDQVNKVENLWHHNDRTDPNYHYYKDGTVSRL